MTAPLVIEFVAGSALQREPNRPSNLRIIRNGPPGTFVILDHVRISLPTDQIVDALERNGTVTVSFGGMRFTGIEDGQLTFLRVRDLLPEDQLSPARSWTMTLDPQWVASLHQDGRRVWPSGADTRSGLCATCAHVRVVTSSKGSTFLLCERSRTDPSFRRYPTLPVLACRGFTLGR